MPVGRDPAWRGALLDFERSSAFSGNGKGFWVGELQGGFGTVALNVSATVTPADLRIWTWSALARGAKAIHYYAWYPMSTGYESGGFGLIELDGTITERSRAAGAIARVVDRNQQLFAEARPERAQVAVVFNPLAYLVGGRQRVATPGAQSEVASIERDSWLGVYRAYFPSNVPIDYLHVNELTAEAMRPYRLVIFPYPLMIPQKSAAALRDYVSGGGALVSEARLAWNNEHGRASDIIPGLGLHEVTGTREAAVETVAGLRTALRWTAADLPGMKPGDSIPGRLYEERLQPVGPQARVAATFADGSPAAVMSQFGKGKTLTLGSYVCVAYENQQDATARRFFTSLLDWAGVERPLEVTGGEAEARMLRSGGSRLLFVFNHQDAAVEPAIGLRTPSEKMEDLVTGEAVRELRKRIPAGEVWVVKLTP
jgi:beta-galactosidase